ncbi:hypothetical protein [Methylosinus sp. RM1]|uniref:hypothetical protein n=1 Tax=Methylosinus sp. RM1 TaxID=2583817 RepID=UPI00140AB411|nr:hypothetical protein [Methylosinus sp. RM1]
MAWRLNPFSGKIDFAAEDRIVVAASNPQKLMDIGLDNVEAGAPPYRLHYYAGQVDDGPGSVDPRTYWIHDLIWGWNTNPGGARILSGEPAWYLHLESKFRLGPGQNPFQSEFHLAMTTLGDQVLRPITVGCAHDGSYIAHGFLTDRMRWSRHDDSMIMLLDAGPGGKANWHWTDVFVTVGYNDAPFMYQIKNGGGVRALPYYDGDNVYQIEGPIKISALSSPATGAVLYSFVAQQPMTAAWLLNGYPITGKVWGLKHQFNSTLEACELLEQQNATATAHAVKQLQTAGAGSGDPFTRYTVAGVVDWSTGIDNSDGDKFKISRSSTLGSADVVQSDGTTFDFLAPPKLPSFAVAALPSAATIGAGACAFATDLDGAAFAYGAAAVGGGSRGGKVFSDGSIWREG